ncbi:MAG: SAM-dependent chlorinase/fluorinase, partial [Calditrichaeota bacterium]|nr:SAM-dependent chlorinase/fluorinase [Calditrichota bacterium]
MTHDLLQLPDPPVLGLITDFGTKDGYPAIMKGVVLSISPQAQIVDISHEISPQAIDEAAFVLFNTYKYFPKGTLFTIVVDPGVGTDRKIIGVTTENYAFLAPDNGVLSAVFASESACRVYEITEKRFFLPEISATFHGRDIFAPVSGQFLNGLTFSEMGVETRTFQRGNPLKAAVSGDKISGKIVYIDRFGNLISNIPVRDVLEFSSGKSLLIR